MINLSQTLWKKLISLTIFLADNTNLCLMIVPLLNFSFETTNRLSNINIRPKKISKIFKTLDQNKAHGHDDISVRMIKMCGSSIIKPLQLLSI